jgi:polysaccharide deacetylase family protein (PEP-CTERM system associated)
MSGSATNVLTFDLEEYFQASALAHAVPRTAWGKLESRVERQTETVLNILDLGGAKATFFVLGWVAERHRGLVREIVRRGHEIASHGYAHRRVDDRGPRSFRREIRLSRRLLESIAGVRILGYRAASFSVRRSCLWLLDVLAEEGFAYDSSILPASHDRHGLPGALPHPHLAVTPGWRKILELPLLTRPVLVTRLPAGGSWLRLLPLSWTAGAIRRANRDGRAAVVYLRPWELDPGQPRLPGAGRAAGFLHFAGMSGAELKLRRLVDTFEFTTAANHLGLLTGRAVPVEPARV